MKDVSKEKKQQNYIFQTNVVNGENHNIQQGNGNIQMIFNSKEEKKQDERTSKWLKILESIFAILAAIVTIFGIVVANRDERTITNISINPTALEMKVGETVQMVVSAICSDNSETNDILWVSSNPSVVEVNQNGQLIAIAVGEVQVTAQATVGKDTKSVSSSVKVLAPPTGYAISLGAYNVRLYERFKVNVTPYGEDITEIWLHAKAPSGHIDDFQMESSGEGFYRIETEKGIWEIYAVIKNKAGEYEPSKPEDIVYIEVK